MSVYDLGQRRGVVRPSPLFLAFVALTAAGGLLAWVETDQGSRLGDFGVLVFVLAGWIVSVCFHEFAHAYAAYRAGDRSVEQAGYLTLNPFKYTHPVLSILLPLFFIVQGGIGLPGGAVYLHRHAFRSRAMQSVASFAGPAVNLVLGVVLLLVAKSHDTELFSYLTGSGSGHARFWSGVAFLGFLQITAAVLNLLPVPGLDGWAIIEPYLAPETQRLGDKIKPWGMLAIIVILLYVDQLNQYFFDLVNALAKLTGTQEILWQAGYLFFKFWSKNPL
ncbi:site-2 protease family protein [uncultured Jatrophihabitans sp.]|uniref:site-2 protease family protein n=1 Tax=uncultured Jatrophihabitans sp. TaxID=1610747 RepID=UPI0035C9CA8E